MDEEFSSLSLHQGVPVGESTTLIRTTVGRRSSMLLFLYGSAFLAVSKAPKKEE